MFCFLAEFDQSGNQSLGFFIGGDVVGAERNPIKIVIITILPVQNF